MEICDKKKTNTGNFVSVPLLKLQEFVEKY